MHLAVPLVAAAASWQAPMSVQQRSQPNVRSDVRMVVPKAVAAAFFLPWGATVVINNLPTDQRLRIQKSAFFQQGTAMRRMEKEPPKIRGVQLPEDAVAIAQTFKKRYDKRELELVWAALLKCYGTRNLALDAARTNPQILNPSYSFCNTMLESRRVLLTLMSEQEALDVMRKNPAVLQCGPSLESLGAAEIQSIAAVRSVGNRIFPRELRVAGLICILAIVALEILAAQGIGIESQELSALTDALRPLLGALFGSVFFFTAYAAAKG